MIKIFAGPYPTPVSNHLILNMQIIKVVNPHTRPIKGGTFVRFVQRLEACYCNTDDTRARPSSEIHAKY